MRVFPVRLHAVLLTALALLAATAAPAGAQEITAPRAVFGFDIGDDYQLATYTQLERYWSLLADESPRMVLDTIGTTA